ncbi:MAG: hypothetical protein AUJ56_06275 [Zetaproteobacteria bacterium CG1_02_49_23]|nr:MAG: hypothetical protein AUJ56_06275 [Zetaproteobacteria bacterium CG1_02_49_23]
MIFRVLLSVFFSLLLVSCSGNEQAWAPSAQTWQDLEIKIETRPTQLRVGMNEFLVIANRQQRGFSSDLMVDVRTDHSDWKQAMPDGALGVFRKALPVKDVQKDRLYVKLKRRGESTELMFALSPARAQ